MDKFSGHRNEHGSYCFFENIPQGYSYDAEYVRNLPLERVKYHLCDCEGEPPVALVEIFDKAIFTVLIEKVQYYYLDLYELGEDFIHMWSIAEFDILDVLSDLDMVLNEKYESIYRETYDCSYEYDFDG